MKRLITSESVRMGHPDKLCDLISDTVLDRCLEIDPMSRVAVEAMATKGHVFLAGEVTCGGRVDYGKAVRDALSVAGYDVRDYTVHIHVHGQSHDIAHGVDMALESRDGDDAPVLGAGDQGTVYGYATDETECLMPMALHLSHTLCRALDDAFHTLSIRGLGPDGKCQVTVGCVDGMPVRVDSVTVSVQHSDDVEAEAFNEAIGRLAVDTLSPILPVDDATTVLVNPSGRFVLGGPAADTGLTGRKVVVDTYGGAVPHGGGAFSGKDPTKVDRSAAYMARAVARNIVEAGIARRCQVAISYAIGRAEPTALDIDTFGTGREDDDAIARAVGLVFDLTPSGIIDALDLRRPVYRATSAYGHFGRPGLPWEELDRTAELVEALQRWT